MDMKDLNYIVTIARLNSFSQAADALFVSQPALSQAVKKVEKELSVMLFLRSRNHVELTEAGRRFVDRARRLLDDFAALTEDMSAYRSSPETTVTLGISQFYGRHFLTAVLKRMTELDGSHKLQIIEGESKFLENQISLNKIDMGLFPAPIYSPNLKSHPIAREEILLAINRNNEAAMTRAQRFTDAGQEVELAAFADLPFLLLKPGLKLRTLVNMICQEQHFVPRAIFESENLDTCLSLAEDNYGITLLPDTILYSNTSRKVKFFRIKSDKKYRHLVLVSNNLISHDLHLPKLAEMLYEDLKTLQQSWISLN